MTTRKLWLTYLIIILVLGLVLLMMLYAFLSPVLPTLVEVRQTISISYVPNGDSSLVCPTDPPLVEIYHQDRGTYLCASRTGLTLAPRSRFIFIR